MALGRYQLNQLIRVGHGLSVYSATSLDDDSSCEVCLFERREFDAETWNAWTKRLNLVALLSHPGIVRVREVDLGQSAPHFVRDLHSPVTLQSGREFSISLLDAINDIRQLSELLATAHGMGLAHGNVTSETIYLGADGRRQMDLTETDAILLEANDSAADILGLGNIIHWLEILFTQTWVEPDSPRPGQGPGESPSPPLDFVVGVLRLLGQECRAVDPIQRPSARDILRRLDHAIFQQGMESTMAVTMPDIRASGESVATERRDVPERLGRFRLLEKLGQGGMGTVYRAEDQGDGAIVAIKILNADIVNNDHALKRFQKEARMMAAVRSPNIANLIDVNEHDGIHFLAMEYVNGRSLRALLDTKRRLQEAEGLAVIADVCRALADAHRQGIVHRDVKPENVLVMDDPSGYRVKLTDFGLARQVDQSESLSLTQDRMIGTPLYMAPEQANAGTTVDARADVYALGATLFHVLAGRPPFLADTTLGVLMQHANEPVPRIREFARETSDGAMRIIERAMAKRPADRFGDAFAMMEEIERLRRGEPSSFVVHPIAPNASPERIREFVFEWDLASAPEALWPQVANTERINRAIGLPAVRFTNRRDSAGVRRFGRAKKIGIVAEWEEHPFEWIEGRRFSVLREMHQGPFEWLTSAVELMPRVGGGTKLVHTFRLVPRGILGRLVAAIEIGIKTRRALERVYKRIDATVNHRESVWIDCFENVSAPTRGGLHQLDAGIAKLMEKGVSSTVAEGLRDFLLHASNQSAARIRPLALAERLGLDPHQFVDACLLAAHEGLLVLMWDILCPICRIPTQIHGSLKAIREHDRCDACECDFELDFANSVEMIFRVHRRIRPTELGTYCIGGPGHSPHVAAQVRLAAGESLNLELNLEEGEYRFRGPQLPYAIDFRVSERATALGWDLRLSQRPGSDLPRQLQAKRQTLGLTNNTGAEILVRIERMAPRTDACTAVQASTMPRFRELFPEQTLNPGQRVNVSQVTLLITEADQIGEAYRRLGDAQTYEMIEEHFRQVSEVVGRCGGAIVKTIGAGMMAAFSHPRDAVEAAIELWKGFAQRDNESQLRFRTSVHRGPALAATINDRLDYFGLTTNQAMGMLDQGEPGDVVMSPAMTADQGIMELLNANALTLAISPDRTTGRGVVHRIVRKKT